MPRLVDSICTIPWSQWVRIFVAIKQTICRRVMSILHRQFCTFSELSRSRKWTAESWPKQCLIAVGSLPQKKRKPGQSKPEKISRQERGDNRCEFHALVQLFTSMKAMAPSIRGRRKKSRVLQSGPRTDIPMYGNHRTNMSMCRIGSYYEAISSPRSGGRVYRFDPQTPRARLRRKQILSRHALHR